MSAIETPTAAAHDEPIRLPRRKLPPLAELSLRATVIFSGVMLLLATFALLDADSLLDYAKAITLALSATTVSYGVNRLALERGAPLGTTGYHVVSAISVLSIVLVGVGLFAATYSGLTIKSTAELQLQQHGAALGVFVGRASGAAAEAGRADPAVRAIESDLLAKAACEIASSCVSGRGKGGNGPVARAVAEHAGRASSISQQIAAGDAERGAIVVGMNTDLAEYQRILGNEDWDVWARRAALQIVDGRIRQSAAMLNETAPLALLGAYAAELQTGIGIPGRPEAEARLSGILSRHGQSLAAALQSIERGSAVPPSFPPRTGVSDTFGYIWHFLPIAAIAAVVELVFPLVLWAYTYFALHWETHKKLHARDAQEADRAAREAEHAPTADPLAAGQARRQGRNGYAPRGRDVSSHN